MSRHTKDIRKDKKQFESDMAEMLEFSDREFKTTMINILREFPGGLEAKTPGSQYRGPGHDCLSGN